MPCSDWTAGNGSVGKGNNSDVNIICNLNWATGEIRMASIYRDTYLNVSDKNSYNKINFRPFSQGGPTQAVKALNKNSGFGNSTITPYLTGNAVAEAINILGGVDIEITKREFYYINAFITETVKATGIPSTQLKNGRHEPSGWRPGGGLRPSEAYGHGL